MSETVEFGIDLGTTNSAISRMTVRGAEIIPVRRLNYIPSVVAIDRRGSLKVGTDALNAAALLANARWFKRLMGTTNTITLSDGKQWKPEELSSEVLKALKAAVKLKTNEDIEDVVITVPAMFSQPQCHATNEAARMAGLNAVSLLQEPIAAATAYLSESPVEGYHLVYDLGGGTFDVSLIRLKDGEMNVIRHGGDNYLGGSDFDRNVFDWALNVIDRKGGYIDQFKSASKKHQLLIACEEARIALSDVEMTSIYLDDFDLPIDKIELTRTLLEDLIGDFVSRTIRIAQERIVDIPASSGGVKSILLVGGPTQMPYIRQRLQSELGIPLNLEQDPMTVVARGAAIHAGSILKKKFDSVAISTPGTVQLALSYDPVSPDEYSAVAGRITSPEGFRGEIEISSTIGDYSTGWIRLSEGAFSEEVTLSRKQMTEFKIQVRDSSGSISKCEPNSFLIRGGVRAATSITPYDYGIVYDDGKKVHKMINAGSPLPASGSREFNLSKALIAGSLEKVRVNLIEGNSDNPDDNFLVGYCDIKGTDINRTLKEGEPVEIRVRMDEKRLLKSTIYIPLLDKDYVIESKSVLEAPNLDDLKASIETAQSSISEIEEYVDVEEQDTLLQNAQRLEKLEANLERVKNGELGEGENIQKQLSDTKNSLRPLINKYGLESKYKRLLSLIGATESLCNEFDDSMGLTKLEGLHQEADKAYRLEDGNRLSIVSDRVDQLFWEHYPKTHKCWEGLVDYMKENASRATNSIVYFKHVKYASDALEKKNYEEVRLQYNESIKLLPEDAKSDQRFSDANLRLKY